jgi:universal stress protein E
MSSVRWKSIVAVVTNPSAQEQLAAVKAAALAARCNARLTLFNAFMIPQPTPDAPINSTDEIIAGAIRDRRKQLQRLAKRLRRSELRIRVAVKWDFPAHEAIVRHVLETKPDLVVAESHRHGRVARWILANTDWELIRSCPAPIWFVRSAQLPRQPRVLVGVDPQHAHAKSARLDDRLLAAANVLTQQLGGQVSLAHAYEPPLSAGPGMLMEPIRLPFPAERSRESAAHLARAVRKLAERHGVDPARCILQQGSPSEVLPRIAQSREIDVLVMGAVSRSLLARPVIGNTAERVIDRVACDVFIVKPVGFKTPVQRKAAHTIGSRSRRRAA